MALPLPRSAAAPAAAAARTELVFATWNIHGHRPDAPFDAAHIADVIARTGADVVALQEAGAMAGGVDQAAAVAALLGMRATFGPNVTRRNGDWRCGNALLTRLPVLDSRNHDLSVPGAEPRGCLVARIGLPRGAELVVASSHFGLSHRERTRQAALLATLFRDETAPLLLGMDGNDWFPGRDTRTLRGAFADAAGSGARRTYPSTLPLFRLDHIYVRTPAVEVLRCVAPPTRASDHLPVVASVAVLHR